jgi:hypothetical protein
MGEARGIEYRIGKGENKRKRRKLRGGEGKSQTHVTASAPKYESLASDLPGSIY